MGFFYHNLKEKKREMIDMLSLKLLTQLFSKRCFLSRLLSQVLPCMNVDVHGLQNFIISGFILNVFKYFIMYLI
jgi:hypothetical protein